MVGAELFLSLLRAIKTGAKLIMIGDDGQLESIGLCNIFKDMLDSGVIPVARLTKIHRQAAKSAIITESIKVRQQEQLCVPGWVGEEVRGELQDLELNVYNDNILTQDRIIDAFKRLYEQHHNINNVSNRSTCETIIRVLALWVEPLWKYWLTRFFSFFALPT